MINKEATERLRAAVKRVTLPEGPRGCRTWDVQDLVICTDTDGDYITVVRRLDNGCPDLLRYTSPQLRAKILAEIFEQAAASAPQLLEDGSGSSSAAGES